MKVVTICMPERYVDGVDELIAEGMYPNRSEVIRIAIRDLLVDELWSEGKPTSGTPLILQIQKLTELKEIPSTEPAP